MFFDKNLNLHSAAEEAFRPCLAGMAHICTFAHQCQLSTVFIVMLPHVSFKTYVIPAGMYASRIWATPYLQERNEMNNCIQKWLPRFLKSILGVRSPTPSRSVLHECRIDLEPAQFNWFRATVRLCNSHILAIALRCLSKAVHLPVPHKPADLKPAKSRSAKRPG
eukprot:1141358-Pelagomonas_calceolata.AAC.17